MELGLSDAVAFAAFVLSVWTYRQTSRYRGGDILLAAIKERAELDAMVKGLEGATVELLNDWRAVLAARGMLHSGSAVQKEQITLDLQARIEEIAGNLEAIPRPVGKNARQSAEGILAQLYELRAKANAVVAAVEGEREAVKANREDLRSFKR